MLKILILLSGLVGSTAWACPIMNGTFKSTVDGLLVDISSTVDENQIVTYKVSNETIGKHVYVADGVTHVPLGIKEYTGYVNTSCPNGDLLVDIDVRLTKDNSPFWHFVERYSLNSVGFSYQLVSDMINDDGTFTHSDTTTPYLKVSK